METRTPALLRHAELVYDQMVTEGDVSTNETMLWEGYTTKLFEQLSLSVPYYTKVLGLLQTLGCIAQERRGGGGAKSVWRLFQRPTLEEFEKLPDVDKLTYVSESTKKQKGLEQRDRDLLRMINALDDRVSTLEAIILDNIDKALKEAEDDNDVRGSEALSEVSQIR